MEADRFQNLKYAEPEFKTESLAVLGEYNKNSSNPVQQAATRCWRTPRSTGSTYKHTTMGFLKDIQDMPNQYEYSLKFFDRYYRPEYTTIMVVGDVKAEGGARAGGQVLGRVEARQLQAGDSRGAAAGRRRATAHVDWPGATLPIDRDRVQRRRRTPTPRRTRPRSTRSRILAFSQTSDLYQKLVVTGAEGRCRSSASMPDQRRSDAVRRSPRASKKPDDLDYVRDQILATVKSVPGEAGGCGAPGHRAQAPALFSGALRWTAATRSRRSLASYVALRRTPETLNKLFDQYATLTPEDVQQAAAKYLVEKRPDDRDADRPREARE